MRCTATRADGQPCRAFAAWDSGFCPMHARARGLEQAPLDGDSESAVVAGPLLTPLEAIAHRMQQLQTERDEAEAEAGAALGRANRASLELIALSHKRRQLAGV